MTTFFLFKLLFATTVIAQPTHPNWYTTSFYLLHEDYHTTDSFEVGRDADLQETARLLGLSKPDAIQVHAKGNPGWTTYPTKVGYTPPLLARDVLAVWRAIAQRDGYPFSIYYNLGRDGEIMKRHPEWNRVKADGTPYDKALCYHSGVAQAYLWPMIREIMKNYRPEGFWFDGSCFTVHPCYCDKCKSRFKQEQGLEAPTSPQATGWNQYKEMQRAIYRAFVHQTVNLIHTLDPKCLVAVNWAYSFMMPEKPDAGIDYLTGDVAKVENLSYEAHWYDAQDLPFDLMTNIKTPARKVIARDKRRAKVKVPKPRPQIEQEMSIVIANGGRYFAWGNPTPEGGLIANEHEFLGRVVAPFLRQRQPWCLDSKRTPDASLLHSAACHYAVTSHRTDCFISRNARLEGAADALTRLHINYEMLPDWRLQQQDVRSPLLIVEHPSALTPSTVESLIPFVRNGGTLLMTGAGLDVDKRLHNLFGIENLRGADSAENLTVMRGNTPVPFKHRLFRIKREHATQVLAVTDTKGQTHPLMTRNAFGQGVAYYVAIPLLTHDDELSSPPELLQAIFDRVLPPHQRLFCGNVPDTVECVLRQKGTNTVLHLVNIATGEREVTKKGGNEFFRINRLPPAPACQVSIRLPSKPVNVTLQPQGTDLLEWQYHNGRLEAEIPGFDIHQMVVMKIAPSSTLLPPKRPLDQ